MPVGLSHYTVHVVRYTAVQLQKIKTRSSFGLPKIQLLRVFCLQFILFRS